MDDVTAPPAVAGGGLFGLDYEQGPGVDALKKANVHFVIRYVSKPGFKKNLSHDEAKELIGAGIAIVIVFEIENQRAMGGHAVGHGDAVSADEQAVACGAPKDIPIYFAVDWDATPSEQTAINDYLAGASAAIGKDRVGVYGGYYVVKRALDAGVCDWAWQTLGWSGGQWDSRAHLQQYEINQELDGAGVDYDRATATDFGQWPRPGALTDVPAPEAEPASAPAV